MVMRVDDPGYSSEILSLPGDPSSSLIFGAKISEAPKFLSSVLSPNLKPAKIFGTLLTFADSYFGANLFSATNYSSSAVASSSSGATLLQPGLK